LAFGVLHSWAGGNKMKTAKTFGYITLATLVAGILVNLHDIRRYIRISMM